MRVKLQQDDNGHLDLVAEKDIQDLFKISFIEHLKNKDLVQIPAVRSPQGQITNQTQVPSFPQEQITDEIKNYINNSKNPRLKKLLSMTTKEFFKINFHDYNNEFIKYLNKYNKLTRVVNPDAEILTEQMFIEMEENEHNNKIAEFHKNNFIKYLIKKEINELKNKGI